MACDELTGENENALVFYLDLAEITALPNDDEFSTLLVTEDRGQFPIKTLRFRLQKRFPEVTAVSADPFKKGQPFPIAVTAMNMPYDIGAVQATLAGSIVSLEMKK